MAEFTHIRNDRAQMVDISAKDEVTRTAVAVGKIFLKPETMQAIRMYLAAFIVIRVYIDKRMNVNLRMQK